MLKLEPVSDLDVNNIRQASNGWSYLAVALLSGAVNSPSVARIDIAASEKNISGVDTQNLAGWVKNGYHWRR